MWNCWCYSEVGKNAGHTFEMIQIYLLLSCLQISRTTVRTQYIKGSEKRNVYSNKIKARHQDTSSSFKKKNDHTKYWKPTTTSPSSTMRVIGDADGPVHYRFPNKKSTPYFLRSFLHTKISVIVVISVTFMFHVSSSAFFYLLLQFVTFSTVGAIKNISPTMQSRDCQSG